MMIIIIKMIMVLEQRVRRGIHQPDAAQGQTDLQRDATSSLGGGDGWSYKRLLFN